MKSTVQTHLKLLQITKPGVAGSGLLAVDDKILNHPVHEVLALRSAQKCKADFVYFRYFADGRPPLPQVYIYDNTQNKLTDFEIAEVHRKVWNRGEVPLMYVFTKTAIDIFSCVRQPDFLSDSGNLKYNPAKSLKLAGEVQNELDRFSGKILDSGAFWDNDKNAKLVNKSKAAHQSLVTAISDFDKRMSKENFLDEKISRRLLILCILIKYLEDRGVFPDNYFQQFRYDAVSFFDILQDSPATIKLFENLEEHFNGDVFVLKEYEKKSLTADILQEFATVIEGKTLGLQMHFWKLYSFEDIPVEIISYIYQNFVTGKDAVYTPHFLVDLLLDETMPFEELSDDFKILDPACGSGVFLVGAYKRLVSSWRFRNEWKKPTIIDLKKLLKNNIYGVDLDPIAAELTAFSLSLALCDALQPDVIWNRLKFDKLKGDNICAIDFFTYEKNKYFDLIIGNPPFDSKLTTEPSCEINDKYAVERGRLPDTQLSYLFVEHGFQVLKDNGKLCMILPHGILYNYGTQDFRKHIFSKWHLEEVLDFISIRGLFKADVKICTLIMQNKHPDNSKPVAHITFRRNKNTHEQLSFEIDHYDVNYVPRQLASNDRLVWRSNLLGGMRVYAIAERISMLRTLGEFIKSKGWAFGEGFIVGKKGNKTALFITGKRYLPTDAFTQMGIDRSKLKYVEETKFESPRSEIRFTPPMILIKEHSTLPIIFWEDEYVTFRHKIISISNAEHSQLKKLFDVLRDKHDDYQFFLTLLGSQALTGKATALNKKDIDNLPFPKNLKEMVLSKYEQIIMNDILGYMEDFIRLGHQSTLLKKTVSPEELKQFGDIYCDMLSPVYQSIRSHEPVYMQGMICFPFYFKDKPQIDFSDTEKLEEHLETLVRRQHYPSLRVLRVIRLYEGNVIYLIKPDKLRYWIRSVAIQDADETFTELRRQES
jgi:type I restriction-modification system DNA methylase subunit